MKAVDYKDGKLYVKFYVPSSEFNTTLAIVKQCEGRSFDAAKKHWVALPTQENITHLLAHDFIPTQAVKDIQQDKPVYTNSPYILADIDTSVLDPRMYPYQIEGLRWLEARNANGVIGLPVGLGKSNIAASYGVLHRDCRPVLVICPACVKYNWQREIKMWTGEDSIVLSSKDATSIDRHAKWVIINYDIIAAWEEELMKMPFKYLIGDESAYVNNPKAIRTKVFIRLARTAPKRVLLSATPIRNRPAEFFTALNLVDPKTFHSRYKYLHRYCDPRYNGFAWDYKGLTNEEELFSLVSKVMFRKKKEDVLKDLPKKQKIVVPFALDNSAKKKYDKASKEFIDWVQSTTIKKMATGKKHIETLRQLAYIGKRDGVIEWIANFLESGEKLVVFVWHTDAIDDIFSAFKDVSVVVDGRTSSVQKQKNIDAFQEKDKVKLFIGQITAAGVGINLTAASSLAIVEFPWTPGDLEQAMGRIDRIGQKSSTVTFYYLVGAGTVDEDTALLLDEKSEMLDKTLDGEKQGDIFGVSIVDMLSNLYQHKGD